MPGNAEQCIETDYEPQAVEAPPGRPELWAWRRPCQHLNLWLQLACKLKPCPVTLPMVFVTHREKRKVIQTSTVVHIGRYASCDAFTKNDLGCRGRRMSDMGEYWAEDNEFFQAELIPARALRRIQGVTRSPLSHRRPRPRQDYKKGGPTFGTFVCRHIAEVFAGRPVPDGKQTFLVARVRSGEVTIGSMGSIDPMVGEVACTENTDGKLGCEAHICNRGPRWLTRNGMLQRHYQDVLLQRRADGRLAAAPGGGGPQGGGSR